MSEVLRYLAWGTLVHCHGCFKPVKLSVWRIHQAKGGRLVVRCKASCTGRPGKTTPTPSRGLGPRGGFSVTTAR